MAKSLEELEERVKQLEHEMERQEAYHAVANLITKSDYWGHKSQYEEVPQEFLDEMWSKRPDIKSQIGPWGIWDGPEGRKKGQEMIKFLAARAKEKGEDRGILNIGIDASPVIEVAKDGKTARGLWICPAVISRYIDGKLRAMWFWQKRAADFIKEDGKWKIWHYHVYGIFTCPWEKGPAEAGTFDPEADVPDRDIPDEFKPDRPTIDFWIYDPKEVVKFIPAPPEPYVTFSETESY